MFSAKTRRGLAAAGLGLALGLAGCASTGSYRSDDIQDSVPDPVVQVYQGRIGEVPGGFLTQEIPEDIGEGYPRQSPEEIPAEAPDNSEEPGIAGRVLFGERSMYRLNGGFSPVRNPVTEAEVSLAYKGLYAIVVPIWNNRTKAFNELDLTGGIELPELETRYGNLSLAAEYNRFELLEVEEGDDDVDSFDAYLAYRLPDSGILGNARKYGPDTVVFKFEQRLDRVGRMYRIELLRSIPIGEVMGFNLEAILSGQLAFMEDFFEVTEFPSNVEYKLLLSANRGDFTLGFEGTYHDGYGKREYGGFGNDLFGRAFVTYSFDHIPIGDLLHFLDGR